MEKIYNKYNKVQKWTKYLPILFTLSLFHLFIFPASAQIDYNYTKENPVIIASDWDFPPYEYSNDQGEPAGYNVELLQKIKARIAQMDHWTDKDETKASVQNLIRDELYMSIPDSMFDQLDHYREVIYEYVYSHYKEAA